jgi:hypothetical protein
MTGRFDKCVHYNILIMFQKIQILVLQYYVRISYYSALAVMYFTEQCQWASMSAVITM